jgi:MFS family permease
MTVRMAVHGWLILELSNDSEFWIGIYALLLGIGQFLFSSLAGTLTDRFQRRNLLIIEGAISTSIALLMTVTIYLEVLDLWMALAVAFFIGCLRATRFTVINRFIYDIVGSKRLVNGVSLWRVSTTPMMIGGAMLAGALIEWAGIWAAYALITASLAISLPFLLLINVKGSIDSSSGHLLQQTIEGLKYTSTNPSLRILFTVSIVMEMLGFAFLVMVPVMAKNVLQVDALGMGFLQAGVGAGMFVGTLFMATKGDSLNKPRIVFLNALGAGITLIIFAFSRSLPLSVFLAGAVMAFLNVYDLTLGVLIQLVAPPNMRGRAVSLHSLAISFTAVGGFVMGGIGSIVGVPVMIATGGIGIVINAIFRRRAILTVHEYNQRVENSVDTLAPTGDDISST